MHLLLRETRTLDDDALAVDLGGVAADVLVLSFSDSDLGAFAAAWQAIEPRPTLRLVRLTQLRHPLSVDLFIEHSVAQARCVIVRLLGGLEYWRYGAEELATFCRRSGIPLALLPGDARDDAQLAALSTVALPVWARLDALLREGGPDNTARALRLAAHMAGLGPDDGSNGETGVVTLPAFGEYPQPPMPGCPVAAIVFYRSHLLAGDIAPIDALATALRERGMEARAVFVASLKDPSAADFLAARLRDWSARVVLNATGFSAPIDGGGAPVLQLIQPGTTKDTWAASSRGLSPADLAMQVVLPELDGRLLTTAISFKAEQAPPPGLAFSRMVHAPDADGVALAADRAAGWVRLAQTPPSLRRVALVLSDYPGAGGQIGHAVGLDTFASLSAILALLRDQGYACDDAGDLVERLCHAPPTAFLTLHDYRVRFAGLPEALQQRIVRAWGEPADDPALTDGGFALRHVRIGRMVLAVQPDRGAAADRKSGYHDADLPPRHAYVAFHLWLRQVIDIHALVHLGTHGTLEWLPGKAAALSADCAPVALLRGLPVIYPFIVNNPGEAAAAKRRLGAVTIGHMTPPLRPAGLHGETSALERLIDEYAEADGLDRRRTTLLRREILERAETAGLLAESGALRDMAEDAALARLDAYLCDVKDLAIHDGLHVFGGAGAEAAGLLAALDGRFVPPGPAGAPSRGRADVLPTGRNLYTVDPRAIPTRTALMLAERAAEDLLRRHRQDHGDWPRALVIDLWGSATMRTGGEELALALILIGARPVWDDASNRVTGIDILPLALLDRPRVDVTLRISGLFRDAFEAQIALFDQAVRAIAARDEAADWNPLAGSARGLTGDALRAATMRIYGAAPGSYGAGDARQPGSYLAASCHAYGRGLSGAADGAGFAARIAGADAFVHVQDHHETDVLDGIDYAAHEGGFAAAATALGAAPALYHLDTGAPDAPRARTLAEEIARIVRGRAANPAWLAGMLRHGYQGAAEIARTLDALHGFAITVPWRLDAQCDLMFAATLGDAEVDAFLRQANPDARRAMAVLFEDLLRRGLWHPRGNTAAQVSSA